MALLAILKLVGFATGAALHLYITWLIWKRRLGSSQKLTQYERTYVVLGLCLSIWFIGNLCITLHEMILGRERLTAGLRAWNAITMIGVAMLPAALLHAHIAFLATLDNYKKITARQVRLSSIALYLPMLFLPFAIYLVTKGSYQPFLIKLRPLLLPYSIWYLLTIWASAAIDLLIVRKFPIQATRERQFFKHLAVLFIINGALEFAVVGTRRTEPNDVFWVAYMLLSLLPAFLVAYHVYRYKLVDIAIKGSLVYASTAIVFMIVYIYGIRQLGQFLVTRYEVSAGVIEAILILGMFALASPFVRTLDRMVETLFTREIGLYRDVVRQIAKGAEGFGDLNSLLRYTEETIKRGLELSEVRIAVVDQAMRDGVERRLAEKFERLQTDVIEKDEDVAAMKATAVYALKREDKLIGLMAIAAESQSLTSEKRAVLDVLAGQIAVEIESCRLIEEKVYLERELASRERLAILGQMATTIAHEVKNPLSSIKSIAQVMREEEELKNYDSDLQIIVNEIDRLNRTVSQLLSFARPGRIDTRAVALSELVNSTVTLFSNEAKERGVKLRAEIGEEYQIAGAQAAALREALSNLVLNAVQACEKECEVVVQTRLEKQDPTETPRMAHNFEPFKREENGQAYQRLPAAKPFAPDASTAGLEKRRLIVSVTDTGAGISVEEQLRVFEPFYTTKSRGTGLGLAIVQRRAVELGGSIELLSPVENQHGTSFRLIVPLEEVTEKV
jgi:signal transduction histidine kinase